MIAPSHDPAVLAEVVDGLLAVVRELATRRGDGLAARECEQLRDRLRGVESAPAAPTSTAPVAPTGPSYADVAEGMRKREAARVAAEHEDTTERSEET